MTVFILVVEVEPNGDFLCFQHAALENGAALRTELLDIEVIRKRPDNRFERLA